MSTKHRVLLDAHDVVVAVGVCPANLNQQFGFNEGLVCILVAVLYHLQSDLFLVLVIVCAEDLSKRTLPHDRKDFIAVADLILCVHLQIAMLIVEVVADAAQLRSSLAHVIHQREPSEFILLEGAQQVGILHYHDVALDWKGLLLMFNEGCVRTRLLAVVFTAEFEISNGFDVVGASLGLWSGLSFFK